MEGRYRLDQLKPGDWVIVGVGRMAVGWDSACDREENRQIRKHVRRIKSIRKTVVLESRSYSIDRVEANQVLAVFDSEEAAERTLGNAMAVWDEETEEVRRATEALAEAQRRRWRKSHAEIERGTNR